MLYWTRPEGGSLPPKKRLHILSILGHHFLTSKATYWVIFGRTVIGSGAEGDGRQEKSQEKSQQPDGKLSLDHIISIWRKGSKSRWRFYKKITCISCPFCGSQSMSCCCYHERLWTYIFQTGRRARTPVELWWAEDSLVDVSSSCLLYQDPPRGYRAAAGSRQVSDQWKTK